MEDELNKLESIKSLTIKKDEEIVNLKSYSETHSVPKRLLLSVKNSKLAKLVNSEYDGPRNNNGSILIDQDSKSFNDVLQYLSKKDRVKLNQKNANYSDLCLIDNLKFWELLEDYDE